MDDFDWSEISGGRLSSLGGSGVRIGVAESGTERKTIYGEIRIGFGGGGQGELISEDVIVPGDSLPL
jgi:hypothetical protein